MDEQSQVLKLVVIASRLQNRGGIIPIYVLLRSLKDVMSVRGMEMQDLDLPKDTLDWFLADGLDE